MYTQCPDCNTAFRVTAEVLKQAAGKVRCGSCKHAFNALEFLSEAKPEPAPVRQTDEALPELTPDPGEDNAGIPASISAEQSAALLKTLDELAGSDIRIEDTGVEWRVFDDDELGVSAVDELLEESPTPVDQILTDSPAEVDAPEVFGANPPVTRSDEERMPHASEPVTEEPVADELLSPLDELRFDDNTPLPDDFDADAPAVARTDTAPPDREPEREAALEPQADLDLTEPDEWTDILDEFEDLVDGATGSFDAIAEETVKSEDEPEPFEVLDEIPDEEDDTAIAHDEHGETDETDETDEPLDMDAQFALQAEALGIDLSGIHEAPAIEEPVADDDIDLDELLRETDDDDRDLDELLDEDMVEEDDGETVLEDLFGDELHDTGDEERGADDEDDDVDEESPQLELIDGEPLDEPCDEAGDEDVEAGDVEADDVDKHYVPPMTEEEQTINMMIDQDLMSMAVPGDDGLSATIVIPDKDSEANEEDERPGKGDDKDLLKETGAGFETIIMEGEHIRTDDDEEKQAADAAAAASLAGAAAAEREAQHAGQAHGKRYGMIAGAVVLVLLLAVQAIHQSRDALATNVTFNRIVGPAYRAIGKPLTPDWDITGWRFEATTGSTDENNELLTVYSRIGNTSGEPLPYPLIAISLTDRFEETIGSRILDPADYLGNDLDPRKLVPPDNTFDAVISIRSPAEAATGFKLNVCYRVSGGQLRCAIDDFK
jgi:predicted Zn finger-like uncharacterized protein